MDKGDQRTDKQKTMQYLIAVVGALLFVLHPVVVEPVCWVTGRKDLLALCFGLISLYCFEKHLKATSDTFLFLGLCGLAFILALLSKPSILLLPVFFIFRAREAQNGKGLVMGIMLLSVSLVDIVLSLQFEHRLGAIDNAFSLSAFFKAVYVHTKLIWVPINLSPKYLEPLGGAPFLWIGAGVGLTALLLALAVLAYKRTRMVFNLLMLALLSYLPNSNLIPLTRQYSDSYVYLSLAFLIGAIALALEPLIQRRKMMLAVLCALTILFAGLNLNQQLIWRNGVTLWSHVYDRHPDSPQVCRNLGNAYIFSRISRPEKARATYLMCISTLGRRSFFLKNLAIATFLSESYTEARQLFIEYQRDHPADRRVDKYVQALRFLEQ